MSSPTRLSLIEACGCLPGPAGSVTTAAPAPVMVVGGSGGRRPLHVRRAAMNETEVFVARWRRAGGQVELALVHAADLQETAAPADHRLPHELDLEGDGVLVARRAGEWLADRCCCGTVHAAGWRAAAVGIAARRRTGIPVVVHLDQLPPRHRAVGTAAPASVAWAVVADCDAVVVESAWARTQALANGVPRRLLSVAHPGTDVSPDARPWRSDPDRPPRVLSLGAPGDVEAVRSLARAVHDVDGELVVGRLTGFDPQTAAALRAHLAGDVVTGRLGDRLRVLEPPARDVMTHVDLVADVSTQPGRGLGLLAGMAAARAVLACDVGPAGGLVVDRVTGVLVAPGATGPLRRTLATLLRDPFRLEAYGLAGLDRLQAAYTPQRFVDHVAAVHARLAAPETTPDAAPGAGTGLRQGLDRIGPVLVE